MAKERRDSRNRILRPGEYQKPDGRYAYRYKDINGDSRYVYSWTLTQSDRTPPGKTAGLCLRELEKQIANDLHDEIDIHCAKTVTLNERFDAYMASKYQIKETTRQVVVRRYDRYVRNSIGKRRMADIKYSHMLEFYSSLVFNTGLLPSTVGTVHATLNPVFKIAVRDRVIRDNPQTGVMAEINKLSGWQKPKRHALTLEQQRIFFRYIKEHNRFKRWWPLLIVAVGTGCRAGELIALTWSDCDFDNDIITIRRNMVMYKNGDGKNEAHITTTKTAAGNREIPMLSDVKAVLLEEKKRQLREGFCTDSIDGVSGFVFTNMHGRPIHTRELTMLVRRFSKRYNEDETALAKKEGRQPVLLPVISPHILRHTFCTRLCENNVNIKVVQEVMGHTDIATTMDVYNEATRESKQKSFVALEQKVVV